MRDAATAVPAVRRRIAATLFWRQFLAAASIGCVLIGGTILLSRQTGVVLPPWTAWLIGAAVIIVAAERARRQIPPRAAVVALIDTRSGLGGLLMAGEVLPLGAWRTPVVTVPRVVWQGRRMTMVCALCALFAVGAAFLPTRETAASAKLALGSHVDRLQQRIELLREEQLLPADRAEAMTTTLEQLRSEAAGEDPARAWETLDTIDETTARTARDAAEATVEKAEALTRSEVMAMALQSEELDPAARDAGRKDFAEAQNVPSTALTPEQLKAIAESAKKGKAALRATLQKLSDAGLIDPKALRAFERAAEVGNRGELARFLKENAAGTRLIDSVGEYCRGVPGVSRGRGDAPLFFGEETGRGGEFQEQTLPAASAASLANSEVVA